MVLVAAAYGDDNLLTATTRIESKRPMSIVILTSDNQTLTFEKDIIRIGCAERSDVRFSRHQVASEHAELQKIGGRWLIKSVSDENVHVDGKPSGRLIWLQPGDSVRINSEGAGFVFQPSEPAVGAREKKTGSSSNNVSDRPEAKSAVAATAAVAAAPSGKVAGISSPQENQPGPPAGNNLIKYSVLSCVVMAVAVGGFLLTRNGSSGDAKSAQEVAERETGNPATENAGIIQANQDPQQEASGQAEPIKQDAIDENRMRQAMTRRLMIGYEVNTERKLLGQVWAMDSRSVIGSALLFENLQKTPDQVQIFVHNSNAGDPVCYLDRNSIRIHSSFSMDDKATMHSAVGKAQPSKSLDCAPLNDAADVLAVVELVEGLRVIHQGFSVPLIADKAPLFDLTTPPPALRLDGQISYVSPKTPKIIRVKFPEWDSSGVILEGGFVTTTTGQLAGTLANGNASSKEFNLIPIERNQGLH